MNLAISACGPDRRAKEVGGGSRYPSGFSIGSSTLFAESLKMGFAVLAAAALFKEPPVTIATLPERSWVLIASGALVVCPEPERSCCQLSDSLSCTSK